MSVSDIIFASLGTALFIGLIILVLIWLFIYTAVKAATKHGIVDAYREIKKYAGNKTYKPRRRPKKRNGRLELTEYSEKNI